MRYAKIFLLQKIDFVWGLFDQRSLLLLSNKLYSPYFLNPASAPPLTWENCRRNLFEPGFSSKNFSDLNQLADKYFFLSSYKCVFEQKKAKKTLFNINIFAYLLSDFSFLQIFSWKIGNISTLKNTFASILNKAVIST